MYLPKLEDCGEGLPTHLTKLEDAVYILGTSRHAVVTA
jgi:hypothetical protein